MVKLAVTNPPVLMPTSSVCIVARPMSRTFVTTSFVAACLALVGTLAGCESLDGRKRNRLGNRYFKESNFAGAIGQYEQALKAVDDPTIHFNLGLAYAKIFKPGYDKPVTVDVIGSDACQTVPDVKETDQRVCIKEGDTHFNPCDDKDNVCPSSYKCEQTKLCTADDKKIAQLAAKHFQIWIDAQPSDEELDQQVKELEGELAKAIAKDCGPAAGDKESSTAGCATPNVIAIKNQIDALGAKQQIRGNLTQLYIDSDQFDKALAYWNDLLAKKPNDPVIMGTLAGISLKSGDWRKSIEWYTKVAAAAKKDEDKVGALKFIGNVAWSKLNSRTLSAADSFELADRGIAALQAAAALSPKTPQLWGLQGSLFNFRAILQGASWAAGVDRASAIDLQAKSRVLNEEAKKAAGQVAPAPTPTPTPGNGSGSAPTPPTKTGG